MKKTIIIFILTGVLFLAGSAWSPTPAIGAPAVVQRSDYHRGGYGNYHHPGGYHRPYPGPYPHRYGYHRPYPYRVYHPPYYGYRPYVYPYYYFPPPPPLPVPYYPGW